MTRFKWIYPVNFIGLRRTADVREWGFRLDMHTEFTYYTYEWGRGVTCVLLGFGFEVCWCSL